MSIDFQLKVKAFNLSNYRFIWTPKCYARIEIDDGLIITTSKVIGSNPEWNECFDISLTESSTIKIQLFHVQSSSKKVLRGTTLISVQDCLPRGHKPVSLDRKFDQAGNKLGKGASVVLSLCRKPPGKSSTMADSLEPKIVQQATSVETVQEISHPTEASKQGADEVLTDVGRAEATVTKLKGYDGSAVYSMSLPSSDLYGNVLGYIEKVVQFGDVLSQVHPYAQLAWNVLTAAHKALRGQAVRDDKIRTLLLTIRDMLEFVEEADALSKISKLQDTVSSMMAEIHKCAQFIQEYGEDGLGMRIIRDNFSTTTDARIEQYIATFKRLKENFNQQVDLLTLKLIEDMHAKESDKDLENLPGWNLEGVRFDESKACLAGTRRQLLDNIRTWVHSHGERGILWLSGGAGTGKTSVSNSVAIVFKSLGLLGACFCFNRDTAELNNPSLLFGNLCYQLAYFDKELKSKILAVIHSMGYIPSSSLRTQARELIVETMNAVKPVGPVVVIIDALDESGSTQTRKALLEAISTEFPGLPQCVKVLITSRDEPDIRASLQDSSKEVCIDDAENTPRDIASYIQHRLTTIQRRSHLHSDWPGPEKLRKLANRAGHLFIWAAIACNFVEEKRNPAGRLDLFLNVTDSLEGTTVQPLEKLDILYTSILRNAFPDQDDNLADFHYVVGSIVSLETPLTKVGLNFLLGFGDASWVDLSILQRGYEIPLASSDEILSLLRPILRADYMAPGGKDSPLRLLHPSLHEFLISRAEERFRINPLEQNRILAVRCLDIMNNRLRFDICKIGDPSLLNKEIGDLPKRIDNCIPEGFRYCCRSFGFHLAKVSDSDAILIDSLKQFITVHLLHWIEVMSLLGEISNAEACLHALADWLKGHTINDHSLGAFVADAIALLRNFGPAVRLSALHTYHSALALTPKSTSLFKGFIHDVPRVPDIISSHPTWPALSVRVMEGHTHFVNHVVFSPDGKRLASASGDKTVRIWDVESGQSIGDALKGHTNRVNHITFSPDGTKLASASSDKTIKLWDVQTGRAIGMALEGHTDWILHVTFSPDGTKLASTSGDKTLRLWDVNTGQAIGRALEGHTGSVCNVVFSPDGKKLASSSHDGTVRLWDVEGRQTIGEVFKGHTQWVNHVVFAPDGQKLASASDDKTVRLWDVESGHEIRALKAHTDWVSHVVFSPDGKRLASASADKTLRLWDVESGQPIRAPLKGHTAWVRLIAYSPDGRKLASASDDGTVRLWDAENGEAMGEALIGHTAWVWYVAFSPDGMKLASASFDQTVRLWDIENGESTGHILKGHIAKVDDVVFSPDGKKAASASDDKTVRLWDIESGQAIGDALEGHTSQITCVVFSPDGKILASASGDQTLRLWDVERGQALGDALRGHTDWVNHALFSPDGKMLASASYDGTVRLWDVENGHCVNSAFDAYTDVTMSYTWVSEGFMTSTHYSSAPDSNVKVVQASMSFDQQGFLRRGTTRLVWLPPTLRGRIYVQPSVTVVASETGAVTFIKLS